MVARDRLNDELRRLRESIRSDDDVLARVDTDGDGSVDGEEWDRARRSIIGRLEREVESTAAPVQPVAPPRMETCDHFVVEWLVDRSPPRHMRHRGPYTEFNVRSGDRVELGVIEHLLTLNDVDRRRDVMAKPKEIYYSIRPTSGDHVRIRRYPTFLGEAALVCSVYGRTMAHVQPKSRVLKYAYRVDGEDGRSLWVARRPWDDRCERGRVRTEGERKRPRSRKLPDPYHLQDGEGRWVGFIESRREYPEPKNRKKYYRQWIVRLEPGQLSVPQRWGVIGTLAFLIRGPFMLRGWVWDLLPSRRY